MSISKTGSNDDEVFTVYASEGSCVVNRRIERIGSCQEQLAVLVGKQASQAMVVEIMEQSPKQHREQEPQGRI